MRLPGGYCFQSNATIGQIQSCLKFQVCIFVNGFIKVSYYFCKKENNLDQVRKTLICEVTTLSHIFHEAASYISQTPLMMVVICYLHL